MKRRSWQIEFPHIGDLPGGTCSARNAAICAAASASVTLDARTRSMRPERPWVFLFQSSIFASVSSL